MNAMDFKIGTKLEFSLIHSTGQKSDFSHVSQLLDIVDESNIVMACPIHGSQLVPIPVGTKIEVVFIHEKRSVISFEGTVTGRSDKDNVAAMQVHIESEISRIQRRQFFRLECLLDVQYRLLSDDSEDISNFNNEDSGKKVEYKKAVTSDLSGSGVCIVTDESIPKDSIIEICIFLDEKNVVKAIARLIRSSAVQIEKGTKYKNGLHFVNISKTDRNRIIKYVFAQQRKLLKDKGSLPDK